MAVVDLLVGAVPEAAVLFPILTPGKTPSPRDILTFQYWPASISDASAP